ncbi:hypothetical protein [Winogradskyella sp.]|uniref:hypothetical protein n=1 Tax=Winogradskyella sp. TaxID=1883156 RepID=UPI0025CFDA60|nr:hypothetical protein [Winogradskyella sp.]
MKNLLLKIIFLFAITSAFSQEIEVIKKTDSVPNIKEKGLTFINSKTELNDYYFIAKIKVKSDDFNEIIRGIQKMAIDFSANAFKFIHNENSKNKTSVTIELFSVLPKFQEENKNNNETNVIYFFGNDTKTQKFKIDENKIELKANEIFRFEIPKNKTVKINKGGFTGMTVYHQWKEKQPVIFYAFGSGNLSTFGDGKSSVGLSINTGKIIELRNDFAYLLMEIKK